MRTVEMRGKLTGQSSFPCARRTYDGNPTHSYGFLGGSGGLTGFVFPPSSGGLPATALPSVLSRLEPAAGVRGSKGVSDGPGSGAVFPGLAPSGIVGDAGLVGGLAGGITLAFEISTVDDCSGKPCWK